MNKNTLIGLGIGAAALAAGWHFWGRKWAMTMKGNAATVRQQAKSVAHSSIADREIQRNARNALSQSRTPDAFTQAIQAAAPDARGRYTNDQIRALLRTGSMS